MWICTSLGLRLIVFFTTISIFLQLDQNDPKTESPFKFNFGWIEKEYFKRLIINGWKHFDTSTKVLASEEFNFSLKEIKRKDMAWDAEKHKHQDIILKETKLEISELFNKNV
jgi:hypothetical protein